MTADEYPTPEQIAEWGLPVLDAAPEATRPWAYCDSHHECDHCGTTLIAPLTGDGWIYDGDPAVCLGCGSVFRWAVDAKSRPFLQDLEAILSREALASLIAAVEGAS